MATARSFRLPSTFLHNGWCVRYILRCSENESASSRACVVFVHGTPWSSDVFRPIADALYATGNFNIVLYDLPGYGQSQVFNEPGTADSKAPDTSVRAQGEALAALLHHLHLDGKDGGARPHIVAHDIAGVISLRAHLLHGCEYSSLCLLDTNCVLPWGDKLYNSIRSNPAVFKELPPGVFEGCLRAIISSARAKGQGLGPEWIDILARPWLAGHDATPELPYNSQANFVRQIHQSDDRHTAELLHSDLYGQVRCDVKLLWGEEDEWIPREKIEKLARLLGDRHKATVTVPGAGHLIMLDQPERVTLEIGRWLEQHL